MIATLRLKTTALKKVNIYCCGPFITNITCLRTLVSMSIAMIESKQRHQETENEIFPNTFVQPITYSLSERAPG